jgi:hypothetical protein
MEACVALVKCPSTKSSLIPILSRGSAFHEWSNADCFYEFGIKDGAAPRFNGSRCLGFVVVVGVVRPVAFQEVPQIPDWG